MKSKENYTEFTTSSQKAIPNKGKKKGEGGKVGVWARKKLEPIAIAHRLPIEFAKQASAPKTLNLFDIAPVVQEADALQSLVSGRNGKAICLTPTQNKLLIILQSKINPERAKIYIDKLKNNTAGKTKHNEVIDLREVSKELYGRTTAEYLRKTEEQLFSLAEAEQALKFKDDNGNEFVVSRPLIQIEDKARLTFGEVRSKSGIVSASSSGSSVLVKAEILYNRILIEDSLTRFCPIPKERILELKRTTDLFWCLYYDLCGKWEQYVVRRGYKGENIYSASFESIVLRTSTDYESSRAQVSRFKKDLKEAVGDLIQIGIITDRTEIDEHNGVVRFSYNNELPKLTTIK